MLKKWIAFSITLLGLLCVECAVGQNAANDSNPVVSVERQPLEASVKRLVQAMQIAGSPFPEKVLKQLDSAYLNPVDIRAASELQEVLDASCLAFVHINPESRVKVAAGPAKPVLDQRGWTNFIVKVMNEAGVTAPLTCTSPQAEPMVRRSTSSPNPKIDITPDESEKRWLDISMVTSQPMTKTLSGLSVEYRILQLYSRDAGKREATLAMHVGQGTQDLGFRSELPILFDCRPAIKLPLKILDENKKPTICSLLIRDHLGRVYPNPTKRLAPDFFFHEQIYRADGDTIELAPGKYQIAAFRGPEYTEQKFELEVKADDEPEPLELNLKRWIHMAKHGWFSGDHHVHAAGCAHYENPTEGVKPEDMVRHLVGEDLNVGCVLSWGPCWYYQKQFFDGKVSALSRPGYLMRYDVEVSGFPSSHAGHLCLLNLTEDDYPGTKSIEEWPTWTLPVLHWGKQQGGVVGYSHSGWGLALPDYMPDGSRGNTPNTWGGAKKAGGRAADVLPDYAMPPFDGIGANEFIVAVVHDVCDFISAVDTPAIWELNIWYHTLNCGFRSRISGETDFPCIYGERVGLGRSYVHAPVTAAEKLDFQQWAEGIRDGRSYVSDGMSHLIDFKINGTSLGQPNANGIASQLDLPSPGKVVVACRVAAMLPAEQPQSGKAIASRRLDEKPYWHLERARVGESRKVPVDLVINGQAVERRMIEADGTVQSLDFEIDFQKSSWVAIRILPSMHSNPIFVQVADQPIRASKRSAQWCRDAVETCWQQKNKKFKPEDIELAKRAYEAARVVYEEILQQSVGE
jgi:hypothetical protein